MKVDPADVAMREAWERGTAATKLVEAPVSLGSGGAEAGASKNIEDKHGLTPLEAWVWTRICVDMQP